MKAMQRRCSEHRRNRNSKSQLDAKEHHLKQKLAEETATLNEQGCIQVDLDSKEVSFKHQCCLIQEEYKKVCHCSVSLTVSTIIVFLFIII